jgi:ribonuclease-3
MVGAVFLDGGFDAASGLVERLWGERMRAPVRPLRDPKTMLQEWAQARGLPTPTYREVERTGPHHDPEFRVAVALPDREPAEGQGRSKRAAEQAAAAAMLKREGVRPDRADG